MPSDEILLKRRSNESLALRSLSDWLSSIEIQPQLSVREDGYQRFLANGSIRMTLNEPRSLPLPHFNSAFGSFLY